MISEVHRQKRAVIKCPVVAASPRFPLNLFAGTFFPFLRLLSIEMFTHMILLARQERRRGRESFWNFPLFPRISHLPCLSRIEIYLGKTVVFFVFMKGCLVTENLLKIHSDQLPQQVIHAAQNYLKFDRRLVLSKFFGSLGNRHLFSRSNQIIFPVFAVFCAVSFMQRMFSCSLPFKILISDLTVDTIHELLWWRSVNVEKQI